jgi:hypothetical protein
VNLQAYLPALQQHGLLTHTQALAAGLLPRDIARLLRDGAWVRLRKGVYADRERWEAMDPFTEQPRLRIFAADLVIGVERVYSHDSAALLLGLGVPDARSSLVHITRPAPRGRRVRMGIKHHGARFHPWQVTEIDGLPVLDSARTAVDMGREHGLGPGVAACDAALRLGATRAELEAAAEPAYTWPHGRTVRHCVELADPGAESYLESLGRVLVDELGIGRAETQFGLTDGHRTVWCDLRVGRHIFEIDGWLKYVDGDTGAAQQVLWKEKRRQDFISGFQLGVSRITHHDCHGGRRAALVRLAREYAATEALFGHSVDDLAPYILRRPAA